MSSLELLTEQKIVTVEINGGEQLSHALVERLNTAINRVEDLNASALLFICIRGGDLKDLLTWPGEVNLRAVTHWERTLRRLERADSVTAVYAARNCSALALEILTVVDRRISSSDFVLWLGATGQPIWPGMVLYRLVRQIGEARTKRLFLEGAPITAEECRTREIIDDTNDSMEEVLLGMATLATGSVAEDFPIRRRLMQDSCATTYEDALGAHLAACDRTRRSTEKLKCR